MRLQPATVMRRKPCWANPGDREQRATAPRDNVAPASGIFLIKTVHRHHAAALAVGLGEHRLLGDRLSAHMDGPNGRACEAVVRDEAPAELRLDRLARLGIAAKHKLHL
jgi:hypothetical protein